MDDERDLAAGEALGALSPDDKARLDELVLRDQALAAELEGHQATVSALETGVARTQPSDDLFDRILAEVNSPSVTAAEPLPLPVQRARRWRPRALAAGLAAAAVIAIAFALSTSGGRGDPDVRAAVAGTEQFAGVSGEAKLFAPQDSGGVLELELDNVPAPPSGHHYQVWVLREEGGGAMEAVGSFTPTDDSPRLEFQLPGPGRFDAVDVSLEPDGGSAEHSGVSLAGGAFGS